MSRTANPGGNRAERYRREGWWNDDTLVSLLDRLAVERAGRPAIVGTGGALTYDALAQRVGEIARGLSALGVGKGHVVSVQLPNLPEFLIAYLAVTQLGAVMNPIHMAYGPGEARGLMRHAGSRAVICQTAAGEARPAASMIALTDELATLEHVVAVGADAPEGAIPFDRLGDMGAGAALPAAPAADDPFLLLFTSGTSASPKAVKAPYRWFLSNARINRVEKRMDADSTMLSAAPYTHLLGLYAFHLTLYAGCANLLLPVFSPTALVETIAAGRPTHLFVAPAHVAACDAAGLLEADRLASIRFAVVSGSMAPPDLYRRLQSRLENGVVGQLWGMTETQCGMFTRPEESRARAARSCGRPSRGNEARICGDDGEPLAAGVEGELQLRGCSVFDGYDGNDAATAESFTDDGWFRTGDLAVCDRDGFVSITGRNKDIINRGGVKMNPADVEAAIDRHPDVVQSAIVPMPDPVLGERACCFAVARPGASLELGALTDWLAEQGIAKVKWPERLELVEEMPLTPTRKVIKSRLRLPG